MRIGIDIGGTKTDAVAVDDRGQTVHQFRLTTGYGGPAVLDTAAAAISRMCSLTGLQPATLESIGLGVPGMVDASSGEVRHAANLGFSRLDLGSELHERFGVQVRVENDVNAAALGAYRFLDLNGTMAYLNLGTGMAAGIVSGGRLMRGSTGNAGEIGHIPLFPDGASCPCGQRGCLETVASGSAISRQWITDDPLPARSLFTAATHGETAAIAIARRVAEAVAATVRLLVLTVDVEHIVIGGGVSRVGEPLLEGIRHVLDEWAAGSPFIDSLALPRRVRLVPADSSIAALGAALIGGH